MALKIKTIRMIPKGLLIATIVGVSSSLILGIYLEKTYHTQEIPFTDGSSISILTDKRDYTLDDIITIQIINSGTTNISFSSDIPGFRVRALDGTEFNSASFDGVKLAPKEKHIIQWNQLKKDDSHILEGRYILESFAYDEKNQKIHDSISINIFK
ncbi:MAG: hypothetical protein ACT4OD_00800 [Candidatus Nitrosotenuis sp.]